MVCYRCDPTFGRFVPNLEPAETGTKTQANTPHAMVMQPNNNFVVRRMKMHIVC